MNDKDFLAAIRGGATIEIPVINGEYIYTAILTKGPRLNRHEWYLMRILREPSWGVGDPETAGDPCYISDHYFRTAASAAKCLGVFIEDPTAFILAQQL